MICPYNVATKQTTLSWVQVTQEDDTGTPTTNLQQFDTDNYTMMECPKEGCAVWYDGRCHFSGDIIRDMS
ncbi:MAG: hypothetical protein LUH03_09925 [Oscillospiraceae bacterium]|nr:hypothetical protein [Oscillospiraceae bacterium]